MGAGFVLGVVRVPFLVPRIGERWAEPAEMPVMAAVIFLAAGYVLRRFPDMRSPGRALTAGLLAPALAVFAELRLAVALQERTLAEIIASRDKVSGSMYRGLLLVFGRDWGHAIGVRSCLLPLAWQEARPDPAPLGHRTKG